MFRNSIVKTLLCLKLCPLPRNKNGFTARTFAETKVRCRKVSCTLNSCNKQNVLKKSLDADLRDELPRKSMWQFTSDCCGNPCPELPPRFDGLYYRMKDKMSAQYQQTWVECPRRKRPKRKPCHNIDELPPLYRRDPVKPHQSACEYDAFKLKDLCILGTKKTCRRIKLAACGLAHIPPKCHQNRDVSDCKKRCCPYPAFSECCRSCLPYPKKRECECLRFRMNCEAYKDYRRKMKYDLAPTLPDWPPKLRGPRY